ncbi:MAG: nitrogenase cofactor biosynthesis protein NifB [Bacillota bacterium]
MKNRNFVNLNVNPCKMCMPMGAVMALKGVENSMVILHGSQGCSTYIRRHMAGHFNEPIDVASSSLSEEGTVYGGEKNLKNGLRNIIKLYNPFLIGVATTCLAETIGEDIKRIVEEFKREEPLESAKGVEIVPIPTPGYGGTQFEGYYMALTSLVKHLASDSTPNGKINVIAGNLNPGDIRNIKSMLDGFGIEYILLPDVSNTLDSPYKQEYKKIADGGTKIEDIRKMAGALATIEMGLTVSEQMSPGQYLKDKFNVPLYKCSIPIGIKNTDAFVKTVSQITGRKIPKELEEQRGRFIDAMIDSHKFNGEGRAVIYGEPELSYAVSMLCMENGIKPLLISTGAQNTALLELINRESKEAKPLVIDDTDFETIQRYAVRLRSNILIGNSDGKVITEREGIPLVRIGFPIHDRVGGQRNNITGYAGSLKLLDDITNTLLENKYTKYRGKMFSKYYADPDKKGEHGGELMDTNKKAVKASSIEERTLSHPCFSGGACKIARMHIPVAPSCNIQCNYCNRKYDCVNESRPGVTSEVLKPFEARDKFLAVKEKLGNLKVVGIAGPGDALADFESTKASIELIKKEDPDITFCLSTNGLMLPYHADDIIDAGVTHITVTINAIDPAIGAKIYKEITFRGKKYTGERASEILIRNQLTGLEYMARNGVICKVNIVMIKGINDGHIEEVVQRVRACGAYMTNIMPLIPARGSAFEDMSQTSNVELNEVRKKCQVHLKQMYHCRQCRADAIGVLSQDVSSEFRKSGCQKEETYEPQTTEKGEFTFAVATGSGMLVDKHFGHAEEFYIYKFKDSSINYIEKRPVDKYCSGTSECDSEESRIDRVVSVVNDCDAVLALRIGFNPQKVLESKGIKVLQTCGYIEDGIRLAIEELVKDKGKLKR